MCFFSAQRAHWIVADFRKKSLFQEIKTISKQCWANVADGGTAAGGPTLILVACLVVHYYTQVVH